MNEISDEDIVRMFHSGNGEEKAFRLLVGKYSERLYWHIRKIVIGHEDSDDVLQNTFIKIWKGLREFRYEAKLFTWMYRVATNEAINFLSEKRRKTYGNSQEITPMYNPQNEMFATFQTKRYFIQNETSSKKIIFQSIQEAVKKHWKILFLPVLFSLNSVGYVS